MTPHIQQVETAELIVASQSTDFAALETTAPPITDLKIANDNEAPSRRPKILSKRRRRRARLLAR